MPASPVANALMMESAPQAGDSLVDENLRLREALGLLRSALDASHSGLTIIDMRRPHRPIAFVNRAVARRAGYSPEELLGQPSIMLTPRDQNPESGLAIRDAMRAGRELNIDIRLKRKDGSSYWSGICLTPIRDGQDRVTHYISLSADITAKLDAERKRKQLAEELAAAVRERDRVEIDLRLAQKLEAVGRLAAGVAHEINTPIQYVGDSVHFLRDAYADLHKILDTHRDALTAAANGESLTDVKARADEAEQQYDLPFLSVEIPKAIDRSLEGIERVTAIVRAMKEFSHPDATKYEAADINHAITSTLTVAKNEYKYVATVRTELTELPPVTCNISELNQVFLNLLVNSAHAIEVTGKDSAQGLITISTRQVDTQVELVFTDNGCGIPQENLAKVFEPFFTTKEVGKGTGQGLAIVRSIIVDKHKGTVNVESVVGQGTQFVIRLPIEGPRARENQV